MKLTKCDALKIESNSKNFEEEMAEWFMAVDCKSICVKQS